MLTIKYRLYDTATHSYYRKSDVFIKGDGSVWYNDGTPAFPVWTKLDGSGEGCELREIRIDNV